MGPPIPVVRQTSSKSIKTLSSVVNVISRVRMNGTHDDDDGDDDG